MGKLFAMERLLSYTKDRQLPQISTESIYLRECFTALATPWRKRRGSEFAGEGFGEDGGHYFLWIVVYSCYLQNTHENAGEREIFVSAMWIVEQSVAVCFRVAEPHDALE